MRWGSLSLLIVALLVSSADARKRTPTRHIVEKKPITAMAKKPKVVAIAKTATSPPTETRAPDDPDPRTNDPLLAHADRVVGRDRAGYVAFTFDDGPNPPTTPTVIAALEEYNIPATFFIVTRHLSSWAPDFQEAKRLLAKEIEHGYIIGNHTAHHANLLKADDKKLDAEMDGAFTTLYDETKKPLGLFRAPYGHMNNRARARLQKLGATEVFWSIDPQDWRAKEKDAQALRKRILRTIINENGGVVLLHDTRKITAGIIHDVLDDLEAENCRRLDAKQDPIYPVSIHYFLKDHWTPRPIPDDVQKRTAEYKKALPDRCAKRAATAAAK